MKTATHKALPEQVYNAPHADYRGRTRGQALLIVALVMTVLILFVGLAVDTGNLMARKAKLQSAVDAAALSAADVLQTSGIITQTATNTAYQVLETNGVTSNTLTVRNVTFPGYHQVQVAATQNVSTYFMRLVPAFSTMQVSAQATADLSSYAEIYTKPYGKPGVVNELNLMVWGPNSWRKGGDVPPVYGVGSPPTQSNPEYASQPYGYLYRVDIPPDYVYDHILIELFDPDSYNRTGSPPAWPTPYPCPGTQCGSPTPTPTADQYASCSNPNPDPSGGACTSNGARYNTGMKLNAFAASGRPAFWRVDELRHRYDDASGDINPTGSEWNDAWATTTQYTLWHFDTHISSAFADPNTLSDRPTNTGPYGNGCGKCVARYTVGNSSTTDLSWYTPGGFNVQLTGCGGATGDCFNRESNGSFYLYLYVQGTNGSSENNFDIRVGPPDLNPTNICTTASSCYVNQQYLSDPTGANDWDDGGASLYAKQSLPLNLDTGSSFPLVFTRVNKNAAGQVLSVRHFDQDCNNGCGSNMTYEMLQCGADPNNDSSWTQVGTGYVGPDNDWYCSTCANPETVQIPLEGTSQYTALFGASGECESSLLRIHSNPSYSQDSTVWQMPYLRPRLIK